VGGRVKRSEGKVCKQAPVPEVPKKIANVTFEAVTSHLMENHFQVVILGTGLVESIAAA
jgi:hypothetical protein